MVNYTKCEKMDRNNKAIIWGINSTRYLILVFIGIVLQFNAAIEAQQGTICTYTFNDRYKLNLREFGSFLLLEKSNELECPEIWENTIKAMLLFFNEAVTETRNEGIEESYSRFFNIDMSFGEEEILRRLNWVVNLEVIGIPIAYFSVGTRGFERGRIPNMVLPVIFRDPLSGALFDLDVLVKQRLGSYKIIDILPLFADLTPIAPLDEENEEGWYQD